MAAWNQCAALLLLAVAGAAAVRPEAQGATISLAAAVLSPAAVADAQPATRSLLTYFLSVTKPQLQLSSSAGTSRPGRTGLTVTLSEPAVSPWMPVVSPRPDGMTHNVVHTWAALKNYALMFARVNALNKQAAPGAARLFPLPGVAVQAASDVAPLGKPDVGRIIDTAEAHGQRSAWTKPSPGSVLLLPHGSSTAAVADVMNIVHDEQSGAISLHLELVHDPHTVSEFEAHGKQSLDVHEAHYHFATPPGVAIDAAGLLASLQDARFDVAGLHVFVKGTCGPPFNVVYIAPADNSVQLAVGDQFTVNVGYYCVFPGTGNIAPTTVTLSITGPGRAEWVGLPGSSVITASFSGGSAGATLKATGPGAVTVTITALNNGAVFPLDPSRTITVTGGSPVPNDVARLAIGPRETHHSVHQHAPITAVAFDASGQPVAGAVVTFAVYGDSHDSYHHSSAGQTSVTTDAQGRVRVNIPSRHPDSVTVVASVTNPSGTTVVSRPAHIVWTDDYYERQEEEHHYYNRGHRDAADEYAE